MNELLTVPPVQIGAWLACLAFTVMLANGLVKLWASVRGKPAPGENTAHAAHRTRLAGDGSPHPQAQVTRSSKSATVALLPRVCARARAKKPRTERTEEKIS